MSNFILSAFADEIDPKLDKQIQVIQKHGIGYIELRSIEGKNVSEFTLDYAKETKKVLDASNIKISAIGSPIGKIQIDDDFDKHLDLLKHVLEIAGIFETQYIRLFSFYLPKGSDFDRYQNEVIEKMGKMAETAKDYPITLLHENEKDIYGDIARRCYDILSAINSPKLRATFDPANFVQCGEKTYPEAYTLLKDYVEYIHIKDALYKDNSVVPAGQGDGCVKEIIDALKEDGFSGFLSLEPHLGNFAGFSNLETDLSNAPKELSDENKFAIAVNALKQLL